MEHNTWSRQRSRNAYRDWHVLPRDKILTFKRLFFEPEALERCPYTQTIAVYGQQQNVRSAKLNGHARKHAWQVSYVLFRQNQTVRREQRTIDPHSTAADSQLVPALSESIVLCSFRAV